MAWLPASNHAWHGCQGGAIMYNCLAPDIWWWMHISCRVPGWQCGTLMPPDSPSEKLL
eukprot:CAMPEP_0178441034 /NCGR_PEP_ID=MMETSP0689_2-20121128/37225_1 /TAXON_ID=160604 /ORGANISM="Amphidinium massartii, Strain CS-259" /LENGTH=57 /DNA_ID=CAMNT_0020064105 /DNA_START=1102 /DNA_END=1272 /DNA_ORIENTATION=+